MRVLVVGANGRTGQLVVDEALKRGHKVTALVRRPESMTPRAGLDIVQGTPLKKEDVETAMQHSEADIPQAVICALNASRVSDNPFSKPLAPPRFIADSTANLREAMQARGIRKIVIMSAFGVADSRPQTNFLMKAAFKYTNMKVQFDDHDMTDKETKESNLDWVIVRPAMLKGEEALPVKELGNLGKGGSFMPAISRASVAVFMMDAAEKDKWNRTTPVICN